MVMVQGAANITDDGAKRSTNMAGMEEAQQVGVLRQKRWRLTKAHFKRLESSFFKGVSYIWGLGGWFT